MRGGVVFLWAAITTVVLVVAGIFATLVVTGRLELFPPADLTSSAAPGIVPEVDADSTVIVLNASGRPNLATEVKGTLLAAGWSDESVLASEAGSEFATTTVYFAAPEDEAAAAGVAETIGGAAVAQSNAYDAYLVEDDPATDVNEVEARRLVIVLGTDRLAGAAPAA